jgi:recombination protein RecT
MTDTPKTEGAVSVLKDVPLRQVQSVKDLLISKQAGQQLAAVAARHMNPERMMRVVANAIRTTPKLQQCEPISFLGALMQCASLGLEPNTILGHAYLIPFDKTLDRGKSTERKITEVQLVVGYKGLIDLARRSGHITSIHAGIHYSDDHLTGGLWEYEEGTEAKLRHRNGDMAGRKQHAYAIAKFKDGGHAYVVLPWAHVMRIRDGSQGYQTAKKFNKLKDTPWVAHEDAMAKKTAIRALAKYLPLSVEFADAMTVDEQSLNYRSFAMDPTQGLLPEPDPADEDPDADSGDVVEGTTAKSALDVGKENAVRDAAAKAAAEKAKPEQGEAGGEASQKAPAATAKADEAEVAAQRDHLVRTILKDLVEAGQGNTKGVLEMYGDQMDIIQDVDPDAMEKINKRAYAIEVGEYQEGNGK